MNVCLVENILMGSIILYELKGFEQVVIDYISAVAMNLTASYVFITVCNNGCNSCYNATTCNTNSCNNGYYYDTSSQTCKGNVNYVVKCREHYL